MNLPNETDTPPSWQGQTIADQDKSRDQLVEELALLRQRVAHVATTDVTQRKRVEEALQQANNQLERRVNELLALNYIAQ